MLSQVFLNLSRNALDEMKQGDTLIIRSYDCGRNVCVEFVNPASGGKSKDPELLFLPFDKGGYGVGLPLSYRMLKDMGGLLLFSQQGDRVTFTVSLLKMDRPDAEPARKEMAM